MVLPYDRTKCSLHDMNDFASVIDKLGGAVEVSRHLGISADAVRKLVKRQAMPYRHWPKLVDLAAQKKVRGLSVPKLAEIATRAAQ